MTAALPAGTGTRPAAMPAGEPVVVLVVDEVEALGAADAPDGLRVHLERVLVGGRRADIASLSAATSAPTWLDAGDLAALTSALVAAEVKRAASP
jgi:hypothetical protein